MQTQKASEQLGEIDRDLIVTRLQIILEKCACGDVAGILPYFAPDVVYTGGTWRQYPLAARREGREACAEMLHAIHVAYESLGSVIDTLVIDGESVALCRTTRLRNRGSGDTAAVKIWNFVRFRHGLVVEYAEYPDTLAIHALDGLLD